MITVKQFCEGQHLSKQGVYAKIKRNSDKLKGHVTKSGGVYVLDDFAADFLKRRPADYPLLKKCSELQNECVSVKAEYEAERVKFARRFNEVTELKKKLTEEKSKSESLEKRVTELAEENNKSSETAHSTVKENLILSEEQQDFLIELRVLNEKIIDLTNQLLEFSEKNNALTNQVTELAQKNEKLSADISERDEKIAQLENELAERSAISEKTEKKKFGLF